MVVSCSAYGCTVRFQKGKNIKFHRFPTDLNMKKKWLIAMKRNNFQPSKVAVICSNHFKESDYEINVQGNKILKKDAVPTVFDFPEHLKKNFRKRDSKVSQATEASDLSSELSSKECVFDVSSQEASTSVIDSSLAVSEDLSEIETTNESSLQETDTSASTSISFANTASVRQTRYFVI